MKLATVKTYNGPDLVLITEEGPGSVSQLARRNEDTARHGNMTKILKNGEEALEKISRWINGLIRREATSCANQYHGWPRWSAQTKSFCVGLNYLPYVEDASFVVPEFRCCLVNFTMP